MGRKAQAREVILNAARLLFWRKGYGAVGVDEICRAAGVNKGSLYHHHRDKSDLACAVIESNAAVLFDHVEKNLAGRPPAERVLGYLDWMIAGQTAEGQASGQFAGCPFGKLAAETAGLEPEIRAAVLSVFQRLIRFIAGALRELDSGRPTREINLQAEQIFMSWQGALVLSQARNSPLPLRRCRQATAAALQASANSRFSAK